MAVFDYHIESHFDSRFTGCAHFKSHLPGRRLIPLAAAFLGVKSNGRAFRYALLAGLTSTLLWNYVLGKPWGVDGTMVGMLCNFLVFTACTKAYQRYDVQKIRVWK